MSVSSELNMNLQITLLFCGLCLLIGCSADEEIQPARLIEARGYHKNTPLESFPLPVNGGGIIGTDTTIELVFDKPVLEVSVNHSAEGQPDEMPPTTIWKLEGYRLDVWDHQIGWNPEKDVILTIIYEDEIGIHKYILDVTLGAYSYDVFPPTISLADPSSNDANVDANRLNRKGIRISFSDSMDPHRTRIEVYSGQVKLDWKMYWTDRIETVILLPESEEDWLLPGQKYEIHLTDIYSALGIKRNTPIVINFQTASE